jgi:hypothetical protein
LLIHQALGEERVAERREAVVDALEVGSALTFELAGEPLAAVEANLDVEREPRDTNFSTASSLGLRFLSTDPSYPRSDAGNTKMGLWAVKA